MNSTGAPIPSLPPPSVQPAGPGPRNLSDIKHWCLARADEFYAAQDLAVAREYLGYAAAIDPADVPVWIALGSVCFSTGESAKALQAFSRAAELDPAHPQIPLHLALTHQQLGNWAEAEQCFRQALQLQPESTQAYKLLSGLLMARGRPAEARECLERSLSSNLDDAEVILRLGVCCYQTEDWKAARACFSYLVQRDPASAVARENLEVVENRLTAEENEA